MVGEKCFKVMYETLAPRGNETLHRTLYGNAFQRDYALNRMCNQTDGRDVTAGLTCDQEAIKVHEVETAAASGE